MCGEGEMPFDYKRMAYGGFQTLVEAWARSTREQLQMPRAARRFPQVADVDLWIAAGRGARLPAQVSSLFGRLCCGGYGTQHVDPGSLRIAGDRS
jgi:hypothetical protein